jgi:hypothetical protein
MTMQRCQKESRFHGLCCLIMFFNTAETGHGMCWDLLIFTSKMLSVAHGVLNLICKVYQLQKLILQRSCKVVHKRLLL